MHILNIKTLTLHHKVGVFYQLFIIHNDLFYFIATQQRFSSPTHNKNALLAYRRCLLQIAYPALFSIPKKKNRFSTASCQSLS